MRLAQPTMPHGRLILTVLGGLAKFERELIHARTDEARERAKERGVHMGRPLPSPAISATRRLRRSPKAPRRKLISRGRSM